MKAPACWGFALLPVFLWSHCSFALWTACTMNAHRKRWRFSFLYSYIHIDMLFQKWASKRYLFNAPCRSEKKIRNSEVSVKIILWSCCICIFFLLHLSHSGMTCKRGRKSKVAPLSRNLILARHISHTETLAFVSNYWKHSNGPYA